MGHKKYWSGSQEDIQWIARVAIVDRAERRVEFVVSSADSFELTRCPLLVGFMNGELLPPLSMGEGTWDMTSPQGKAIGLARSLANQDAPAEPLLTSPEGGGGFPPDLRLS